MHLGRIVNEKIRLEFSFDRLVSLVKYIIARTSEVFFYYAIDFYANRFIRYSYGGAGVP